MNSTGLVDLINKKTMRSVVHEYTYNDALTEPERAALSSVADEVKNKRILDLGVGGGRTVKALRKISRDYVGIDYVQEMVDQCRQRFPGVRFENVDARSMYQFNKQSFDLIVFACNGISMVDHEGRIAIFKEVRRLLRPGGIFIFSTYNQRSDAHSEIFTFPDWTGTRNPARFLLRGLRFLAHLLCRISNRIRYKRHEIRNDEYSIINDKCHNYRTMLYYITLENQRKQLEKMGFKSDARVYDLAGNLVSDDTLDDSVTFLART